eukprot:16446107-Heterocapsa_arctica.AAC.1
MTVTGVPARGWGMLEGGVTGGRAPRRRAPAGTASCSPTCPPGRRRSACGPSVPRPCPPGPFPW